MAGWANDLALVFTYKNGVSWCWKKEKKGKPKRATTREIFLNTVKELEKAGLLRIVMQQSYNADRLFISIFVVVKDQKKLRVIANCKEANLNYEKSPRAVFASNKSIFRILAFFGADSSFAIDDFRHWFHQMGTPRRASVNFTVNVGNTKFYEIATLPMGFSWTPYAAQGISMLIARIAINSLNHLCALAPSDDDSEMPPFWIVAKRGSTWQSLHTEDVVGFTIFWCDNLLIVSKADKTRNALVKAFL